MLIKFDTFFDGEYWCARGLGYDIFTQGKTLDGLYKNIKEAVKVHFSDLFERGDEIKILILSEIEVRSVAKTATN
ncbi:MAG: type II toxin-antitoxin system HicB family antitoxin [Candidatus Asgardarchaeia archaeon]